MFTRLATRTRDNKAHHKTPPAADAVHRKHQYTDALQHTLDRLFAIIASFPMATSTPREESTRKLVNLFTEAQARYQHNGILKMPPASALQALLNEGADPDCQCTLEPTSIRRHLVHLLAFCHDAPDGGKSVAEALVVLAQAGAMFTTSDIKQMVGPLRMTYPFNGSLEEERARHRAQVLGQAWNGNELDEDDLPTSRL